MARTVERERTRGRGRPRMRVWLTPEEKEELERVVRTATAAQRDVRRALILRACAQGLSVREVARQVGVSEKTVYTWRKRFRTERLRGLQDRPRCGPPIRHGPVERLQIISIACEPAPKEGGLNGWTLDQLRDAVLQRGVLRSIHRSSIHRILHEADLKPHKVKGWVHSQDPQFREKVQEITQLYLNRPPGEVVVSVDEKTGVQAKERKYADEPARPGRPLRREFEYVRHGTQSLIAGLNVHTGEVTAECGDTRKAEDLLRFMAALAARYPSVVIHIVWDNLNIHSGERWEEFNRQHGNRFRFHYTPLHASWVNQIELWFSILSRKSLRHGSFASTADLKAVMLSFVRYWNEHLARPFRWTFQGYPLQSGIDLAEVA